MPRHRIFSDNRVTRGFGVSSSKNTGGTDSIMTKIRRRLRIG